MVRWFSGEKEEEEKPFLSDDMTMRLKTMLEMANTISEMTKMPLLYTGSVTLLPRKSIMGAMMPIYTASTLE